jgi:NADH:ubiquinone oxidoreductase subunit F (NADH-binding)
VLLGRGGVAFPAGKKMDAVADDAPFLRFIVCNADEMDPGTFRDRVLIHADPHMLIEWMIITGYGILIDFFARESCGWCTPCREGLPYLRDLLARIEAGRGEEAFIPALESMSRHLGSAYCAFAPGAAAPVESLLTYFKDEVREHIAQKKCPFT